MIEDAGGPIDYDEEGAGPTILFVPGSWGTRSAWRGVIAALEGRYRCVTTSLLGYGGTQERRTAADASIEHEAEVVEAVARRAGGAVHIVGHSFGGQVCLAAAMHGVVPLTSLAIIEPTVFDVLRLVGELALHEQIVAMHDGYVRAFASGETEAARRVIDFYGGCGCFDALPQRMRDYVVTTTPTNILDWRSGMGLDAPLSAYAGIGVPSLIIRGERGHAVASRSAEILSGTMPNASLATVAGASHFMMASHPADVARLISGHVTKTEKRA